MSVSKICSNCFIIFILSLLTYSKEARGDPQSMWEQLGGGSNKKPVLDEVNFDEDAEIITGKLDPSIKSTFERLTADKEVFANPIREEEIDESDSKVSGIRKLEDEDEVREVNIEGLSDQDESKSKKDAKVTAMKVLTEVKRILKKIIQCIFLFLICL